MTKSEQAYQGLEYAKKILNSISVVGIDNCQKLIIAHNNISAFLSMIASGEISLNHNSTNEEEKKNE